MSKPWRWRERKLRHHSHLSLMAGSREILRLENSDMSEVTPTMRMLTRVPVLAHLLKQMPAVNARRPLDDDAPDGYLESDRDWIRNNEAAIIWLLEHAEVLRSSLTPCSRQPAKLPAIQNPSV